MFLYQVFDSAGRCMVSTTSRACTYPPEVERDMKRAGYRIRARDDPPDGEDSAKE